MYIRIFNLFKLTFVRVLRTVVLVIKKKGFHRKLRESLSLLFFLLRLLLNFVDGQNVYLFVLCCTGGRSP